MYTPQRHLAHRGFTVIELLVTIAIAAILVAVAIPSFQGMLMSSQVQGAASEFRSALAIARAEAIKRGGDARVTIVANEMIGTTPNWASGVTVFYDTTSDASGNTPPTDLSRLIMRTEAAAPSVTAVVNFDHLIFNGLGRTINSSGTPLAGTVAFGASQSDWRCTVISLAGRVRTARITRETYDALFAASSNTNGCPTL